MTYCSVSSSVPELRTLLSAAMSRVNLDLTFQQPDTTEVNNETTSYLLLCLLIIEIMSHCGPEVNLEIHPPQVKHYYIYIHVNKHCTVSVYSINPTCYRPWFLSCMYVCTCARPWFLSLVCTCARPWFL